MAPAKPLAGRNAIVTGAGHGIGLAIAERLAREGAFVVMADIDRPATAAEALRMSGLGYSVLPFEVDVLLVVAPQFRLSLKQGLDQLLVLLLHTRYPPPAIERL